jgi:hypothetical protein
MGIQATEKLIVPSLSGNPWWLSTHNYSLPNISFLYPQQHAGEPEGHPLLHHDEDIPFIDAEAPALIYISFASACVRQ